MAKTYWHWDDDERFPRDDFEEEFDGEEALTADEADLMPLRDKITEAKDEK